jgi:uncharacterized protein YceK
MRKLVLGSLLLAASISSASASESMIEMNRDRVAKEQIISAMQSQITRHESMTQDQIIEDLRNQGAVNVQLAAKMGFDMSDFQKAADLSIDRLAQMDKGSIVAMEINRLQAIQTSRSGRNSYLFLFYHWNHEWLEHSSDFWTQGWTLIAMPFAIIGDIVLLPFEVIAELTMTVHDYRESNRTAQ